MYMFLLMPPGLLPEDADPETVTVQHHAEQANGDVTVETVADAADATDGVVEVVESNANGRNSRRCAGGVYGEWVLDVYDYVEWFGVHLF